MSRLLMANAWANLLMPFISRRDMRIDDGGRLGGGLPGPEGPGGLGPVGPGGGQFDITRPGQPSRNGRMDSSPRGGCVVIHSAETVKGGVGTYLRELTSIQREGFGPDAVWLVVPASEVQYMALPAGVRCVSFKDSPNRIVRAWQLARHTIRLVRRLSPRVVHVHSTFAGAVVRPMLAMRRAGVRVIYCAHGWAFDRRSGYLAQLLARMVERRLSHYCDRIVCISKHEFRQAILAGLAAEKLVIIPNGISREAPESMVAPTAQGAPPEPSWPLPAESALRLLFIGRFDRQKGIDVFVSALRDLGSRACGCAAGEVAVDGTALLAAPPNLRRLGWLSPPELVAWLASCDAVVMPSRWEGFGLVAIEAMRAGRAVIASSVGGLQEIVDDGITGFLVPPDDAAALSAVLAGASRGRLREMGERGREKFLRQYTLERLHEALSRLYGLYGTERGREKIISRLVPPRPPGHLPQPPSGRTL